MPGKAVISAFVRESMSAICFSKVAIVSSVSAASAEAVSRSIFLILLLSILKWDERDKLTSVS